MFIESGFRLRRHLNTEYQGRTENNSFDPTEQTNAKTTNTRIKKAVCWLTRILLTLLLSGTAFEGRGEPLLHLIAATEQGGLWHTIGFPDGTWTPLQDGDVIKQAGAPWRSLQNQTEILDIATAMLEDRLFVLVVIKTSAQPCEPFAPCSGRPAGASFSLWQTTRYPDRWDPFKRVTAELGGLSYNRIGLHNWGNKYVLFCGATADGRFVAAHRRADETWKDLTDLNAQTNSDPGRVTAVSCRTDGRSGLAPSIAVVADGSVYHTFNDGGNLSVWWKNCCGPGTPSKENLGLDNLTTRVGIPALVADIDIAGANTLRELHMVTRSAAGVQWHSFTKSPSETNWAPLSAITPVNLNTEGSSIGGVVTKRRPKPGQVTGSALVNFDDKLKLFNVTDDGNIWHSTWQSAEKRWTGFAVLSPHPANIGKFSAVSATEFEDTPSAPDLPIVKPGRDCTSMDVTWGDSSTFELGYAVYVDNNLVTQTGPVNGGTSTVNIPNIKDPGREYSIKVVAIGSGGNSESGPVSFTTAVEPRIQWARRSGTKITLRWSITAYSKVVKRGFLTALLADTDGGVKYTVDLDYNITEHTFLISEKDRNRTFTAQVIGYADSCYKLSEYKVGREQSLPPPPPSTGVINASITLDVGTSPPQKCGSGDFYVDTLKSTADGKLSLESRDVYAWYVCRYNATFGSVPDGRRRVTFPSANACTTVTVVAGQPVNAQLSPNQCPEFVPLQSSSGVASDAAPYRRPDGVNAVTYRGFDNHIYELYRTGSAWSRGDLSALTRAPAAAGTPTGYARSDGVNSVVYRGADNHIHELYLSGSIWRTGDLSAITGAPAAAGDPTVYVRGGSAGSVVYRGIDGHIHELWLTGTTWQKTDLSAETGAPPAAGDPAAYIRLDSGVSSVVYRGIDGKIHELYRYSNGTRGRDNLSARTGAPAAASDPAAYFRSDGTSSVVYRGLDNRIYEIYLTGGMWRFGNLSLITGAPAAAGKPAAYRRADGVNSVVYRGSDNHIHELSLEGSSWRRGDLSAITGAPAAAGNPAAYFRSDGTSSVVYRGLDNHIHELGLKGSIWRKEDLSASAQ
jgi:hypothetical protein